MAWRAPENSSDAKPWESRQTSNKQNPWEAKPGSQHRKKPWENTSSHTLPKPWESDVEITQKWLSTAEYNPKSPWLSQIEFNAFFKENFPFLENYADTYLKEMVLLPCGSLQPANLGDAIAALCISLAAAIGGVALMVLSAGAATPLVAAGWGTLAGVAMGVGISGTINASSGIHNKRFSWESWGVDVGFAAATSFVTFPTCFIGGQAIAGVLIKGVQLSEKVAKAIATSVGGMAASGIHQGSYVLQCEVKGEKVQTLGLILSGIGGFLEGAGAAYLGAKAVKLQSNSQSASNIGGYHDEGIETTISKLPEDSMERQALERIAAGDSSFPDTSIQNLAMRKKKWFEFFRKKPGTGSSVSIAEDFRQPFEKMADSALEEVFDKAGWVRISSKDNRAIQLFELGIGGELEKGNPRQLLMLQHAGERGFGPFAAHDSTAIDNLARIFSKRVSKAGEKIENLILIGCEVTPDFAAKVESKIGVPVKILPPARGSVLYVHGEVGTFQYGYRGADGVWVNIAEDTVQNIPGHVYPSGTFR